MTENAAPNEAYPRPAYITASRQARLLMHERFIPSASPNLKR